MTTFAGHTKSTATTESQTAINNFKRGTKRDASAYPIFKNDLYYDTFQTSFLAIIKAQGLYDVAEPDYDPGDGAYYEQELFQEKQSFAYSVLVTSVENSNTRLLLISCSQGILSSSSFSCYLLLRLLVYMYLSQLMRTFTNYLKCIVISS